MATNIEWARNADGSKGETWNPIVAYRWVTDEATGDRKRLRGWYCEHATTGCINCYSETQNVTGARGGTKLPYKPGHRNDVEIELHEPTLLKPLSWKKPRTIFVCSMTDLFGEFHSDEMIDRVFAVMALSPQHTFQVLTKRAERMRAYFDEQPTSYDTAAARLDAACGKWLSQTQFDRLLHPSFRRPLPNVWLGASAERQQEADERIPLLLQTPAAIRFVSLEPLLGPIDLTRVVCGSPKKGPVNVLGGKGACPSWQDEHGYHNFLVTDGLDWGIVGGESGAGARDCWTPYVRSIVRQFKKAGTPIFVKQLGSFVADRNDAGFDGCGPTEWPLEDVGNVEHDLDGYVDNYQGAPVRIRLKNRKGGDWSEWPEDLRVREMPSVSLSPLPSGLPATSNKPADEVSA